jgi:hypothetical protein
MTLLVAAAAALGALGAFTAACDDDSGPTESIERRTVAAGATREAIEGRDTPFSIERNGTAVPVKRLPDGTLVAGGTPLTAEEATRIAPSPTTATDTTPTPIPTVGPPPTAVGSGRIQFSSYAPITAAVGEEFEVTIVADGPNRAFQGYQWNLYANDVIQVLREAPVDAAGFDTCQGFNEVALNQHYGGCIHLGGTITATYAGPLTVVTLRCATQGAGQARLLGSLEGAPFPSSYLINTGQEFGSANTETVEVTCT